MGQMVSPFNKMEIKDSSENYSFIVSGHFHGSSTSVSTYPASTLLANIDTLNSSNSSFLMSLGDMFIDVNDTYMDHYQKSLFNKLKMPLFNVVGNHDLANGNIYEKNYGKSFYSFTKASEFYIVLNTELNDGSIKGGQLEFFKNSLNKALTERIQNIFIFSHRPVWAENNEKYKNIFKGNTRTLLGSNNFESDIKPLLKQISNEKNIYWISGSLGGGPASFFYDKEVGTNITFMQTAIRDQERDAALLVSVKNGYISFEGVSFTGQKLEPVENYNIDFWNKTIAPEQKFNFRLLPYLTKQMLLHHFFWIGFFTSIILIIVFSLLKKRWKKSK